MPGGGRKPKESLEQAVLREVREELRVQALTAELRHLLRAGIRPASLCLPLPAAGRARTQTELGRNPGVCVLAGRCPSSPDQRFHHSANQGRSVDQNLSRSACWAPAMVYLMMEGLLRTTR
ncbi:MAG: NUDIX domain-containing protein [Candidatus Dormibacteraeota bacterium]|nr:NUDIX domain-containing protein [Candidatus Dormibacteraeota bacterium]